MHLKFEYKRTNPAPPFGLGDIVAKIANPIARALDATIGTNIVGCGGCAKRQAALNAILPDVRHPLKH